MEGVAMHDRVALIIEDESDLASLFGMALQTAGFATEIVRTGDAALARLAAVTPDVVILDLHLPHTSGKEVLHYIRADARLMATPVIVVTADARAAEEIRDQADLALIKPVSIEQLRDLGARLGAGLP
ncbi:MAG TPA: response regulator [Anaerolineae bacterium]|nr:response regulator [Anaerolineae bacterium]